MNPIVNPKNTADKNEDSTHHPVFEATPAFVRRSQLVIEQILNRIRDDTFPIGAKLPSEREIATQMNVSRTVVREALRVLELAGIAESRIGDGTYVKCSSEPDWKSSISATLTSRLSASVDIMEALEARKALDLSVISLLKEDDTPLDTSVPNQIVDNMRAAIDEGRLSDYLKLSLDIHIAIAEVTGNRILAETERFLVEIVREHFWVIERDYSPEKAEYSFQIHKEMMKAIDRGDFDVAVQMVEHHYNEPSLILMQSITQQDKTR